MKSLQRIFATECPDVRVYFDEPMSLHTSFRIGGPADVLVSPSSYRELYTVLAVIREHRLPFFLLGGGTNILVSDRGIRGVVVELRNLDAITIDGTCLVAEAGASVESVCEAAAANSLAGVEFIHGMPGSIGGAVWMNARCYGSSIAQVVESVTVLHRDLRLETIQCDSSDFSYKRSPFQDLDGCIFRVDLQLAAGERQEIVAGMVKNRNDRIAKGHFSAPSAGSLFKNNRDFGAPTGLILDELGLRGVTSGGAAIAPYHGNIFINRENATAADVLDLIRLAVETARRRRSIQLEPEVRLIGEWYSDELAFLDVPL